MCIMVKTIRHPLEHNKISHDTFEAIYIDMMGEKRAEIQRIAVKATGLNIAQINSLMSPELRQGFTGTYRYSVGRLLKCTAGTFGDVRCRVLTTQCDI